MDKKRILWVSEASFLNTGFAVLSYEILSRLQKTGKYELAELGSYATTDDPRSLSLPWEFYGAMPNPNDAEAVHMYDAIRTAQFGETAFEDACLKFKPDIVVDVRDWWMCEFELRSPFRPYYKLLWMPTIDGEPQRFEWLDSYQRADMIVTYSDYGKDVLEREAPGRIKVFDAVKPGANTDLFRPLDKSALRKRFGLSNDTNIIMSVMRNQPRKLFPDLIEMFREYIDFCRANGKSDLANKTYLYLHTSYPDIGFDIGRHIMQNGVGHRTFVSYICDRCKQFYPDYFQSEFTICRHCGALAVHMPSTEKGLTREQLVEAINVADLYIQYSICEGFGMPIAEAKACGVPAMGVDYTVTGEQVKIEGCWPIKVDRFYHEPVVETEQRRALPSNSDAVQKVFNFFNTPKEKRQVYSKLVREDVIRNHSFDRSSMVFERAFDSLEIHDRSSTWDNNDPRLLKIPEEIPKTETNSQFVDWCIDNIIKQPDLKKTYWRQELIKGLNVGFRLHRGATKELCTEGTIIQMFTNMANRNNYWENRRADLILKKTGDRIKWQLV